MSDQATQITSGAGFIAALDQSGGSTPKALKLYGVQESDYDGDSEMFAAVQKMRERIILAPDFNSEKVIGAILFERTLGENIQGKSVPVFLWENRGVVPFLKIDKGLEAEADGVQLLKPIPGLSETLAAAKAAGIYGTKERSVINAANAAGIARNAAQQFELAKAVCDAGLVPIIEPEVNIHAQDKAQAEDMLRDAIAQELSGLGSDQKVMLKLTIPEAAGQYDAISVHPNVLRVVALSGGYSTDEACARLAKNSKMIASFSRALTEGLQRDMSDDEFDGALGKNINQIYAASVA